MRQDDPSRRSSFFHNLFAERHVYLRSGPTSGYVVLSRPFQIGVILGLLLVLGWLGFASYTSVARHLEVVEQRRQIARLEGVNRSLRAAAETARQDEEVRWAAADQVPQLQADFEATLAARKRTEQLAAVSADEAEEIRRELALAGQRHREVAGEGPPVEAAAPTTELAAAAAAEDVTAPEELEELRQQIEAAQARIAELEQREQSAREQVATLESRLEEAQDATANEPEPIMQQLAVLKAGGDDGAALPAYAAGEQAIAALEADLGEARNAIESLLAAPTEPPGEELSALTQKLGAASERLDEIESVLEQIKARDAAIQVVLLNLAPLPPPPAPR